MDGNLTVTGDLVVAGDELHEKFSTSGGPGGQHANKSATRVDLSFDVERSASLDDKQRTRLRGTLANRLVDGVITITADDSRSQWRNRSIARRRLAGILAEGLVERKTRRPTRPSGAARRRRLEAKRRHGELKRQRRRPDLS